MKDIVFLDAKTFPPNFQFAKPTIKHCWKEYGKTSSEEIASRIANANVVLSNKVPLREKEIRAAKNLEFIGLTATGFDHVDLQVAKACKVAVANCVNYGTPSIAEHAFMLMIMLSRNALRYSESVVNEVWQQSETFCIFDHPVFELKGKTLAVCGMGNVGGQLAKMARVFGMEVLQVERKNAKEVRSGYTSFNKAIAQANFISLHLPLNVQTKHLFSKEEFKAMKKTSYLINVARGSVVEEEFCAAALEKKEIAGAAFDVLSAEPPKVANKQHPLLKLLYRKDINLIITPHVAWAGKVSLKTITKQCAENIDAFYAGESLRRLC